MQRRCKYQCPKPNQTLESKRTHKKVMHDEIQLRFKLCIPFAWLAVLTFASCNDILYYKWYPFEVCNHSNQHPSTPAHWPEATYQEVAGTTSWREKGPEKLQTSRLAKVSTPWFKSCWMVGFVACGCSEKHLNVLAGVSKSVKAMEEL